MRGGGCCQSDKVHIKKRNKKEINPKNKERKGGAPAAAPAPPAARQRGKSEVFSSDSGCARVQTCQDVLRWPGGDMWQGLALTAPL